MRRRSLIPLLACIIILAGTLVLIGWLLDIGILKSILTGAIAMRVSTAVSFVLAGSLLWAANTYRHSRSDAAVLVITFCSFTLLLLMLTLLSSVLLGFGTIAGNTWEDAATTMEFSVPGIPSFVTALDFILTGIAGIAILYGGSFMRPAVRIIGRILALSGIIALVGYLIHQPLLFYTIPNFGTGMAMNTAILFVISGTTFFLLSADSESDRCL